MIRAAQLLGRVHHIGDVAGQGSYTETLTAPLPNLIDAGYHVVVVVDSRGLVSDSDRSNNTGISSNAFHVSVPLLTDRRAHHGHDHRGPGHLLPHGRSTQSET